VRGGEGEEEEEEEGTARGDSVFMGLKLVQERTKNEEEEKCCEGRYKRSND